jgi:hypothetical protein
MNGGFMVPYEATAEVFMTAFKALPVKERDAFLVRLLDEPSLREDLIDVVIACKRSREKTMPLRTFLKNAGRLPQA